jgi:hypothetical protein
MATLERRRATRALAASTAVRTTAACAAAVALLLQLILAPPLAMRMLVGRAFAAWPAAYCIGASAERPSAPADHPGSPASPRDHDSCPVCQSHAAPLGPVAIKLALRELNVSWWQFQSLVAATPAWVRPIRLYSSRAPPIST